MGMKTKAISNMVFVYGTLKRGGCNHNAMQEAKGEFVAEVTTVERFPLEVRGLPFLFNAPGEGEQIKGELFALPNYKPFERLDRLEGHPTLYKRELIKVADGAGNVVEVWAYFYQGARHGAVKPMPKVKRTPKK